MAVQTPPQAPFNISSPVDSVSVGQPQLDSFQGYQDAAYGQAQRMLAPQQEAQQKRFDQQMVNKGITAGSQAYNLAQSQMQRGQGEQNASAAFGAMGFGQQAQQQAFGQSLQASQLAQQQGQITEQSRQFDQNLGQRESEFGRNFGQQQYQYDRGQGFAENQGMFNNMMGMGNMAIQLGGYQNQGMLQDYNMGQTLLGMAPGMMNQQVGVNAAYQTSSDAAYNQANLNMQQNANVMSGIGQLASAGGKMMSGQKYKRVYGETSKKDRSMIAAKVLAMPIYDWDYLPEYREKGDKIRFGCMAEDINGQVFDNPTEDTIDVQRHISCLHLTIQEMFSEMKRLELMLWHAVNESGMVVKPNGKLNPDDGLLEAHESIVASAANRWTEIQDAC
ncbi:MAG: hypothetical protein J7K75_03005 [Desulfuromonas sp.]|nr:hypothetical protein [Desulfuromonas sp.]